MTNLKIITLPHPVLRQKAKMIEQINGAIQNLTEEMVQHLKHGENGKRVGVGLAAPQIGKSLRIIIVWSKRSRQFLPMINPEIIWHSKRTNLGVPGSKNPYEGCLSVPGLWGKVRRSSKVKVQYQTPNNRTVIRCFNSFTGIVIQHEIDHLDGILFIDRIREQKGKLYKVEKDQKGKEYLEEVEIK